MDRVRIKDIAEIAQVSIGTVDRVIHNRGEVSPATREKIQRLLLEFDYKPDIAARSLALKREIHLAVVMPKVVHNHSFWTLPRLGIQKAMDALEHRHVVLHEFYFDQMARAPFRALVKQFPYEGVEGILFAPVFQEESLQFVRRCASCGLPVILFNSFLEERSVASFVGQDAYQSGYVAARLMDYGLEQGRDLAVVNMSARTGHYTHITDRERGFRTYFERKRGRLNRLVSVDLYGADDCMLKEKLRITLADHDIAGIFVTNSRVHKVARCLTELDQVVRLVGYDLLPENILFLEQERIDFLLSQRPEDQAYKGFNSLYNLVVFNRKPASRQWLPIDIITRENLPYYQSKSAESWNKT
jgi:LacI family transcriptional regulator